MIKITSPKRHTAPLTISLSSLLTIQSAMHFTSMQSHTHIQAIHASYQPAHQEQFVVQYFAKDCFDIQPRDPGIQPPSN